MMLRASVCAAVAAVILSCPRPSPAQWSYAGGPGGCSVLSLASNGNLLFAGTLFGLFVSNDAGDSWAPAQEPGPAELGLAVIYQLQAYASGLFALTPSGPFLSRDNGASWTAIGSGLSGTFRITRLLEVGSVLNCLDMAGNIFRSVDRGAHWQAAGTGLPADESVYGLAAVGRSLWATIGYKRALYRSTDGGGTWAPMDPKLPGDADVDALAAAGQRLFVAGEDGIFVFEDGGAAWTKLETDWALDDSIDFFAASGPSLLIESGDECRLSNDMGAIWSRVELGSGADVPEISCFVAAGARLFAALGGPGGLFRSDDLGATWVPLQTGFPSQAVITCMARREKEFFAATQRWGESERLFVRPEGSSGWEPVELEPPESGSISCLAISGTDMIAGTRNGLFLSADRGRTWKPVEPARRTSAVDPVRDEDEAEGPSDLWVNCFEYVGTRILAGTDEGILLTEDRGRTWSRVTSPDRGYIDCFARFGGALFAGGVGGLLTSKDRGSTWQPVAMDLQRAPHILDLATDGKTLVAGINPHMGDLSEAVEDLYPKHAILVSKDGGRTWKTAVEGLPDEFNVGLLAATEFGFLASLENPYNKGGRNSLGLYLSTDGGRTWTADWPGRWSARPINQLLIEKDGILAATDGAGIWRLPLSSLKKRTP